MNFALFFTRGLSLHQWDKRGMLEREIKLYQRSASEFEKVYFFTYGNQKDKEYSTLFPGNVVIVPKPTFIPVILYSFILPFIHWKKLRKVSILKTNQMDGSWAAVITKKLFGNKLIIRCGYEWLQFIEQANRSWFKKAFAYCAERFAYRNADKIVLTSKDAQDFVMKHFGIPADRIVIIPNYVDMELFAPKEVVKEKGRIVVIGRLESQKNLIALVHALAGTPLRAVFIGKGSQQRLLEEEAIKLGVSVEFKGTLPQREISTELCKGEIYVLPSLYEGHPKTLLEAMSCGMPCVGANIPGINDTITDGQDGVICDTNAESLRSAMVVLHNDEALRERLSTAARETVRARYSLETILTQEKTLYSHL